MAYVQKRIVTFTPSTEFRTVIGRKAGIPGMNGETQTIRIPIRVTKATARFGMVFAPDAPAAVTPSPVFGSHSFAPQRDR